MHFELQSMFNGITPTFASVPPLQRPSFGNMLIVGHALRAEAFVNLKIAVHSFGLAQSF